MVSSPCGTELQGEYGVPSHQLNMIMPFSLHSELLIRRSCEFHVATSVHERLAKQKNVKYITLGAIMSPWRHAQHIGDQLVMSS